ncbi:hypothetical protein [Pedomonas sp. V897]|uniref:hypothetical protein n=1 Tax=Pedomonas sp. V897 TaxID=3446482 RepID=UPI003EDEA178
MSKLLEIVMNCPAVSGVNAWKDRHYVNLVGFDRSCAGDRNLKIWVKGNVLTIEGSKGCCSSGFWSSFSQLIETLESAGATREGYGDTIEGKWTLA